MAPLTLKTFFRDLDRYFQQIAITSVDDKLSALIDHTPGEARADTNSHVRIT